MNETEGTLSGTQDTTVSGRNESEPFELTPVTTYSLTQSERVRKKRKATSWVWNHYRKGEDTLVCLECIGNREPQPYSFASSTATGTLARHLSTKHRIVRGTTLNDVTQTTFSNQAMLQCHNVMDPEAAKASTTALARLIVDAKLSFQLVESKAFRAYVYSINCNAPLVSRRTIVRVIEDKYKATIPQIKVQLVNSARKIALTCDGWSSRVMRGYFVTTAHWITESFEMKHTVLDFVYFPPPHNQHTTRDVLLKVIDNFNIGDCFRCVTTDSGSEMAPAMAMVRERLKISYGKVLSSDWH